MTVNRSLAVYVTTNRKARVYQAAPMSLQGLCDRLKMSQAIPHTIEAYKTLPKAQQDDLKDIGGFVLGELEGGRRKSGAVLSRCAAVLDADNLPAGGTDELIRRVAALGLCCCVYSTAKHCPQAPRLRVVFPFGADIPAEQYPPVARLLCRCIQQEMTWFDPTTAQAERMMYWPAHCQDVPPVWYEQEGQGLVDAAALLAQQLPTWQDPAAWPAFPNEQRDMDKALKKAQQQDPEGKEGIVGAFCRAYNVPAAMDKYLPGVYEETATEGRYTFTGGSTWGGAVLYGGGKFLYSNHATDPAGGKLVNSFDLVRLHKFSDLDDGAPEGARGNRLPSYAAMVKLAREDEAVAALMAQERVSAVEDFQEIVDQENALKLAQHEGEVLSEDIMELALKAFGVQIRRNLITGRADITGMPATYSTEEAVNTLPTMLADRLRVIGIKGVNRTSIVDCLTNLADKYRYNPVLDMLHTTAWDRVRRFPKLLDILRIDPSSFYALLFRKWLIQCIALAHNSANYQEAAEGVLVIQGPQGIGKTTLFRKLAVRSDWLAEGVTLDMKNKDYIIQAVGVWIAELGELESTLKKEQASLKAFITQKMDRIRAPYAREATDRPRRTSFGATVNQEAFLRDETGARRFWVVPVEDMDTDELNRLPPEWFVQLWAEVYLWWRESPQGFRLSRTEREHLNQLNQQYQEALPGEEEIRQALDFDLPVEAWKEFSATQFTKLFLYGENITSRQTGRVLAGLAREDNRITKRIVRGCAVYLVPAKIIGPNNAGGGDGVLNSMEH